MDHRRYVIITLLIRMALAFQKFKEVRNSKSSSTGQGRLDAFGRPKLKIDYLVLDAKLILINMNYIKKFLFLEIL